MNLLLSLVLMATPPPIVLIVGCDVPTQQRIAPLFAGAEVRTKVRQWPKDAGNPRVVFWTDEEEYFVPVSRMSAKMAAIIRQVYALPPARRIASVQQEFLK